MVYEFFLKKKKDVKAVDVRLTRYRRRRFIESNGYKYSINTGGHVFANIRPYAATTTARSERKRSPADPRRTGRRSRPVYLPRYARRRHTARPVTTTLVVVVVVKLRRVARRAGSGLAVDVRTGPYAHGTRLSPTGDADV